MRFWGGGLYSCKKETNFALQNPPKIENATDQLSQNHILNRERNLTNTSLVVEFQLNFDLVDSNIYYGETTGGDDKIDKFTINYSVNNKNTISQNEQVSIYDLIDDKISEVLAIRYTNDEAFLIRLIDVEINDQLTNENDLYFDITLVSINSAVGCGCSFNNTLIWGTDDPDATCAQYAHAKISWVLNNYCSGAEVMRKKYDIKYYNLFAYIESGEVNNIAFDQSVTGSEQSQLKTAVKNKFISQFANTNGRNKIAYYMINAEPFIQYEIEPNIYTLSGFFCKTANDFPY